MSTPESAVTPENPATARTVPLPDPANVTAEVEAASQRIQDAVNHPNAQSIISAGEGVVSTLQNPDFVTLEHAAPALVEETRRGYKTTEFWGVVLAAFADIGPINVADKNKLIVSGVAVLYAIARGLAKLGTSNVTPTPPVA